jgi:hypothetical protein
MPKVPPKSQTSKMPIRFHRTQRDALEKVAERQGTTATALVRDFVAGLTGVPDPLPRTGRQGASRLYKRKQNET